MRSWFKSIDHYLAEFLQKNRVFYKYKFCKEEPDQIQDKLIYIVGERPYYWMMTFKCPCGCNEVISLNILKTARPRWKFIVRWGKISIYPSIWRKVGCKSHFHVRKGRIQWSYL